MRPGPGRLLAVAFVDMLDINEHRSKPASKSKLDLESSKSFILLELR